METPVARGRLLAWEKRQPESFGTRKAQRLISLQKLIFCQSNSDAPWEKQVLVKPKSH